MPHHSIDIDRTATRANSTWGHRDALEVQGPNKPSPEEAEHTQRNTFIRGAAEAAFRLEHTHTVSDLDATVLSLVAHLDVFYTAQNELTNYREMYRHVSHHNIPDDAYQQYRENKRHITEFNHILREVIDTGADTFDFNELLVFLTNQHIAMGGKDSQNEFHGMTRTAIVGMRNEIAVEQVLTAAGITYELGTKEQDAHGGDFIIDGVSIDVKASEKTAAHAKQKAARRGYNPDIIVWSHITFEDFNGELALPRSLNDQIASDLVPDIAAAVASEAYSSNRQA
jgi:hypothetical protein